jgi:hypothetical protein
MNGPRMAAESFLKRVVNRLYLRLFNESPAGLRLQYQHQCAAIEVMRNELSRRPSAKEYVDVSGWPGGEESGSTTTDTHELGRLFSQYGSDKATFHNYHLIYGQLLSGRRQDRIRVLEIGLGTNNLSVPSNMGAGGRPGASLRAFRDWAPNSEIFGADVDREILFSEERIRTAFVDQLRSETLRDLGSVFGRDFDVIIDDGYHRPSAGFRTILTCSEFLAPGGTLVVEDIEDSDLDLWQIFAWLFRDQLKVKLWRMRSLCVGIVNRV